MVNNKKQAISGAVAFLTLMGMVSLFSDMTHEGARSILGEYLNLAGASAASIGFVSGIGELCGYSLRLISGFVADKTRKYWTLVIAGYVIQVLAIPALALIPEHGWIWACGLVILERIGKAQDVPPDRGVIVSLIIIEPAAGVDVPDHYRPVVGIVHHRKGHDQEPCDETCQEDRQKRMLYPADTPADGIPDAAD